MQSEDKKINETLEDIDLNDMVRDLMYDSVISRIFLSFHLLTEKNIKKIYML